MASNDIPLYDSSNYNMNRPQYRDSLVDAILTFHKCSISDAATDLAVDVATGTGIFARQLKRGFTKVIGTDISGSMLDKAREASSGSNMEFVESAAESMPFLSNHSVDVITVATAAHWFDVDKFLKESQRILKPNGTLAIFGYPGLPHFVDYPQCDELLRQHMYGKDGLDPYRVSGHDIVAGGYQSYHQAMARDSWRDIERRIYPSAFSCGRTPTPVVGDHPVVMDFKVTWRALDKFISTWSMQKSYDQAHPNLDLPSHVTIVQNMMAAADATDMDERLRLEWEEALLIAHPPASAQ